MTEVITPDEPTRAALLAVEERRQQALVGGDIATLDDLFDDSLVHIHAPGLIHTKAQLLEHVATRQAYLAVERSELKIRLAGDVAVITGRIVNRLRNPDGTERSLAGAVTQVVVRGVDGVWRFISFQMTPDGEQVWPALPSEAEATSTESRETIRS